MSLPSDIVALIERYPLDTPKRTAQALADDLAGAARRYASRATDLGDEKTLWKVWLAIQQARGLDIASSLAQLSPQGRRWLGVALLTTRRADVGLAAYASYLEKPGKIGPFSRETEIFLSRLVKAKRGEEALRWVSKLEARSDTTPAETLWAARYLLDTGMLAEAEERTRAVLTRYPDSGEAWELSAQIAAAQGETERASEHAKKAAKRRVTVEFDYDRDWAAFQQDPGRSLVPSDVPEPHWYGGDEFLMPACAGCGHRISQWFLLDLTAIPALQSRLSAWPKCPLLGCSDCMVWMGRHDYVVDHAQRRVTLRNVAISTKEYGHAYDSTPALHRRDARLVPAAPADSPEDIDDGPLVGGVPLWTQGPERSLCPGCDEPMVYVASMTTPRAFDPPFVINNESGFQYHFACNTCLILSVIAQWT